jgi:hypothetical protein
MEKFNFFYKSCREDILSFCGSNVEVDFKIDGPDGKEGFRMYDDGQFKNKIPYSRHPNILKTVIIGKKSWGLWVDQWTDGIIDWTFTKEEIFSEFDKKGIKVPESFEKDFDNTVERKKIKRNLEYLKILNSD